MTNLETRELSEIELAAVSGGENTNGSGYQTLEKVSSVVSAAVNVVSLASFPAYGLMVVGAVAGAAARDAINASGSSR